MSTAHRFSSSGKVLPHLPTSILRYLAEFVSTFEDRAYLAATCVKCRVIDWRSGPPLTIRTLAGNSSILYLNGIGLGDIGARAVAQAIRRLDRSRLALRLYLCQNGIGDKGAMYLSAAIASCPDNLKRLYLEDNLIGDEGARALSGVLVSGHTQIQEVDLRRNVLSDVCKAEMQATLPQIVLVDWPLPSSKYMEEVQNDINGAMRFILFDWLLQVCKMYSLQTARFGMQFDDGLLFRAFAIIDAYLGTHLVERKSLQLVGIASIFLVMTRAYSVVWDVEQILIQELVEITENAYSTEQLIARVSEMRGEVAWMIAPTTAKHLAMRYLTAIGWTREAVNLVEYLVCLAACDYPMLKYKPQTVAVASILIACETLRERSGSTEQWRHLLWKVSQVSADQEFDCCLADLCDLQSHVHAGTKFKPQTQKCLQIKTIYARESENKVACLVPLPLRLYKELPEYGVIIKNVEVP